MAIFLVHPVRVEDNTDCLENDPQIKEDATPVDVLNVELHHFRKICRIPAGCLPKATTTWLNQQSLPVIVSILFNLIWQRRPGAYQ